MSLKTYPIQPDAHGHRTRFSDSSYYDEVCVTCGATDAGSDLNRTCSKQVTDEEHAAERLETAKRQLIGMGNTLVQMLRKHGPLVDDYWSKTLPEVADLLETLLEERKKLNVTLKTEVNVDVGEALLKGKTPEEQEEMRKGFAEWFEINRARSAELKKPKPNKAVVFFINGKEIFRVDHADEYDGDSIEFPSPGVGDVTWGYEIDGVLMMSDQFYPLRTTAIANILSLTDFKSDLAQIAPGAVVGPSISVPNAESFAASEKVVSKIDIDKAVPQTELDRVDANDFGVSLKCVRMARTKYEGEQAKTSLFFMSDWNKLARFKRREYVRAVA